MKTWTKYLIGAVIGVALLMATLSVSIPSWSPAIEVLALFLGANLLGAVVAVIITNFFRFPTDGGYRSQEIRDEFGQDDLPKGKEKDH